MDFGLGCDAQHQEGRQQGLSRGLQEDSKLKGAVAGPGPYNWTRIGQVCVRALILAFSRLVAPF